MPDGSSKDGAGTGGADGGSACCVLTAAAGDLRAAGLLRGPGAGLSVFTESPSRLRLILSNVPATDFPMLLTPAAVPDATAALPAVDPTPAAYSTIACAAASAGSNNTSVPT